MGEYFGINGFCGEDGIMLTMDCVYEAGCFLSWYYGKLKCYVHDIPTAKIVIDKNTRHSSYVFEYSFE